MTEPCPVCGKEYEPDELLARRSVGMGLVANWMGSKPGSLQFWLWEPPGLRYWLRCVNCLDGL